MSGQEFETFRSEMFQLYQQGRYADALALTLREYKRFPDQASDTAFWRLCLLAVTGQPAEAIRTFDEALAEGLWFTGPQLRGDSDLTSLQGIPEFERLVTISQERAALAQADARPDLIRLEPDRPMGNLPLLVALHGNSSNAPDFARYWSSLVPQGWLVALPQSSQVWSPHRFVWDNYERAETEIKAHLDRLCQDQAIDPTRIVVAGFSRGGETAIRLVMTGAVAARGFVAIGPAGPVMRQPDQWSVLIDQAQALDIRGYILVGDQDGYADSATGVARLLSASGIPCELEIRTGLAHEFPPDFPICLDRALKFIL